MAGRITSLSLTPGLQYPAANAHVRGQASSSASAPPAVRVVEEVDSSHGTQVALLTRLKSELKPGGITEECFALFSKLDPHVQFRGYQFLFPNSRDKQEIVHKGMDLFLRNPSALLGKIEDLIFYVKSRIPTLEERTEVVAACLAVPHGVAALTSKYAMERFDDQMFGPQQWISCWGATPLILAPVEKLRGQVLQMVTSTGKKPEKEIGKMSSEECANFLGLPGVVENAEPTEELYECLNRRVRPDDGLLAGFTCVVTYIPQFVKKGDTVLAVTARTLALNLCPNPVQGEAAQLSDPNHAFNNVLTPEDADRTEASCYFVMEQDIVPNTKGEIPSVLIEKITSQGDKGWQLPESRNFFATVFSRRAWKGQFLYHEPILTYGQGKSRNGYFIQFGGCKMHGLSVFFTGLAGSIGTGAGGSRKFLPRVLPPAS